MLSCIDRHLGGVRKSTYDPMTSTAEKCAEHHTVMTSTQLPKRLSMLCLLIRHPVSVLSGFWGNAIAHVNVFLAQLPECNLGQVCLDRDLTWQHLWSELLHHCLVLCQNPAFSDMPAISDRKELRHDE